MDTIFSGRMQMAWPRTHAHLYLETNNNNNNNWRFRRQIQVKCVRNRTMNGSGRGSNDCENTGRINIYALRLPDEMRARRHMFWPHFTNQMVVLWSSPRYVFHSAYMTIRWYFVHLAIVSRMYLMFSDVEEVYFSFFFSTSHERYGRRPRKCKLSR